MVTVDLVVPAIHEDGASLFANFLAQQLALSARRHDLHDQNAVLREEARLTEETIALRKLMERAKSLIVSQRGFTPDEAEEWLVGASVRHGKPLLSVAREIVAVLSNPVLGIDAAA
ncbi:MAG: ANTAR domain-containing protein [Bryobacteraceae bacterium]